MDAEWGVVELEGIRVATLAFGPALAPPVVCLHGWLDNGASFAPLAAAMPEQRLLALELPGHGHSEHLPAGVSYHALDWVVWVAEALDQLGLGQVRLMGHSMGAGIAALLAGMLPERVSRLVLLEGIGPRTGRPEAAPETLRDHYLSRQRLRSRPAIGRGAKLDVAVRARLAASFPLSELAARLLVQRGVRAASDGVVFRNDRRLQAPGPDRLSEEQVLAFLRGIRAPAMLILGETGLRLEGSIMDRRLAAFGSLKLVEVPGGHHVHMDDPYHVAHYVAPFLAEC